MKTYTYILHDKVRDLYKVGQSSAPKSRFRQLCILQELVPIHLFDEDIERELHAKYKDYRLHRHPVYTDGKTEYFRYGGKFKEFIDDLSVQKLPFYTPHSLVLQLEVENKVRFDTIKTKNFVINQDYYHYNIGRKILILLGYLYYDGMGYSSIHQDIEFEGHKIFMTSEALTDILSRYTVDIVSERFESTIAARSRNFSKKLYTRKIWANESGDPIYLIVTEL